METKRKARRADGSRAGADEQSIKSDCLRNRSTLERTEQGIWANRGQLTAASIALRARPVRSTPATNPGAACEMGSAKGLEKAKEAAVKLRPSGRRRDGAKLRAAHHRFDARVIGAAWDVSKFIADK